MERIHPRDPSTSSRVFRAALRSGRQLPFILTLHTFTLEGNRLLPYIHIGPLEIPTFGLLMVVAFATAYYALEGEIKRRKDRKLDPYTVVAVVAFAGILGAKIWHIVDTPADRLNADTFKSFGALLSWFRGGFAWFGGFVAGIAALLIIARRNGVNMLTMLDLSSFGGGRGICRGPHRLPYLRRWRLRHANASSLGHGVS